MVDDCFQAKCFLVFVRAVLFTTSGESIKMELRSNHSHTLEAFYLHPLAQTKKQRYNEREVRYHISGELLGISIHCLYCTKSPPSRVIIVCTSNFYLLESPSYQVGMPLERSMLGNQAGLLPTIMQLQNSRNGICRCVS